MKCKDSYQVELYRYSVHLIATIARLQYNAIWWNDRTIEKIQLAIITRNRVCICGLVTSEGAAVNPMIVYQSHIEPAFLSLSLTKDTISIRACPLPIQMYYHEIRIVRDARETN